MIGARVVVAFIFPQRFVDVGRSLIDGRNDSACGGIRLLPDVYGVCGITDLGLLLCGRGAVVPPPYFAPRRGSRRGKDTLPQCRSSAKLGGISGVGRQQHFHLGCRADSSELTAAHSVSQIFHLPSFRSDFTPGEPAALGWQAPPGTPTQNLLRASPAVEHAERSRDNQARRVVLPNGKLGSTCLPHFQNPLDRSGQRVYHMGHRIL
jgi:hypothetical protein